MDVAALLVRARTRAGLTRRHLAELAGTSASALSAYERGVRSPTVATLDRVLQACGLQIRAQLEPFVSDLDVAVDELLSGSSNVPESSRLVEALESAGVTWAFDGGTALSLHGLHSDGHHLEVVLAADDRTRQFLYPLGLPTAGVEGQPLFENWMDVQFARLGVSTAWTRLGPLAVRITDSLPAPVLMSLQGSEVPSLSLLDLELAHPQLSDVLARLRERRTVAA